MRAAQAVRLPPLCIGRLALPDSAGVAQPRNEGLDSRPMQAKPLGMLCQLHVAWHTLTTPLHLHPLREQIPFPAAQWCSAEPGAGRAHEPSCEIQRSSKPCTIQAPCGRHAMQPGTTSAQAEVLSNDVESYWYLRRHTTYFVYRQYPECTLNREALSTQPRSALYTGSTLPRPSAMRLRALSRAAPCTCHPAPTGTSSAAAAASA